MFDQNAAILRHLQIHREHFAEEGGFNLRFVPLAQEFRLREGFFDLARRIPLLISIHCDRANEEFIFSHINLPGGDIAVTTMLLSQLGNDVGVEEKGHFQEKSKGSPPLWSIWKSSFHFPANASFPSASRSVRDGSSRLGSDNSLAITVEIHPDRESPTSTALWRAARREFLLNFDGHIHFHQ